jgi:hypothetical protein
MTYHMGQDRDSVLCSKTVETEDDAAAVRHSKLWALETLFYPECCFELIQSFINRHNSDEMFPTFPIKTEA